MDFLAADEPISVHGDERVPDVAGMVAMATNSESVDKYFYLTWFKLGISEVDDGRKEVCDVHQEVSLGSFLLV